MWLARSLEWLLYTTSGRVFAWLTLGTLVAFPILRSVATGLRSWGALSKCPSGASAIDEILNGAAAYSCADVPGWIIAIAFLAPIASVAFAGLAEDERRRVIVTGAGAAAMLLGLGTYARVAFHGALL